MIADSEALANEVLAERLSRAGCPTTVDEALAHYMGRHWADCLTLITARWGSVPNGLREQVEAEIEARAAINLGAVAGVTEFIAECGKLPLCVVSSSSPAWINAGLQRFGLADRFGGQVYSAPVHVSRGKPHPDIYIHAAGMMGVDAASVLVIEDSVAGVQAGVAAGMTVVGLCAGSHIRKGHDARLARAGAHHVVTGFCGITALLANS